MAHIPYGYEIVDGQGVINKGKYRKIKRFIHHYLHGASVYEAGRSAGIPLSTGALRHLLANPVYLGDGYYPALIEQNTFELVQEERRKRYEKQGCFAPKKASAPFPVQHLFVIKHGNEESRMDWADTAKELVKVPAKKAAYIYMHIHADNQGTRHIPAAEQLVLSKEIME